MAEKKDLRREKIEIGLLVAISVWLFCAIDSDWDYGIYTLMRLFVACSTIQIAFWHRLIMLPLLAVAIQIGRAHV